MTREERIAELQEQKKKLEEILLKPNVSGLGISLNYNMAEIRARLREIEEELVTLQQGGSRGFFQGIRLF